MSKWSDFSICCCISRATGKVALRSADDDSDLTPCTRGGVGVGGRGDPPVPPHPCKLPPKPPPPPPPLEKLRAPAAPAAVRYEDMAVPLVSSKRLRTAAEFLPPEDFEGEVRGLIGVLAEAYASSGGALLSLLWIGEP
eukprot:5245061-Pleurochrysis_carterae.AAC.1